MRCVGDFTRTLACKLGCNFDDTANDANNNRFSKIILSAEEPSGRYLSSTVLPKGENAVCLSEYILTMKVMIDGPFGSASEQVFNHEAVVVSLPLFWCLGC